jgi:hypothetical protein
VASCLVWASERIEQCSQTADRGYSECAQFKSQCCTWWPCSMLCDIVSTFCAVFTWVANVVCVAWTVITTMVCALWDVVTTIVGVILVTLESIFGWVMSFFAALIELLEMIPAVGAFIRWVLNAISAVVWILASIPDAIAGAIGVRPEKKLRVCAVILSDEEGNQVVSTADAVKQLQLACNVYKRDANIRIIPLRAFYYTSGFSPIAETVQEDWIQVHGRSDSDTLDVPCNADGALSEWGLTGNKFQYLTTSHCFFGTWRRVTGYGAPVTVFFIRSIPGNVGCALWITDYVTVSAGAPKSSPRTTAHEIGHASNLFHICVDGDVKNMMATADACKPPSSTQPDRANPTMQDWQTLLVRASKHASYF